MTRAADPVLERIGWMLDKARAEAFADGWRARDERDQRQAGSSPRLRAEAGAAPAVDPGDIGRRAPDVVPAAAVSAADAVVAAGQAGAPAKARRLAWRTLARRARLVEMLEAGDRAEGLRAALAPIDRHVPMPLSDGSLRDWADALVRSLRLPPLPHGRQGPRPGNGGRAAVPATLAEAIAWCATVDEDLVLRGSAADRIEQINEIRRLQGLGRYVLREDAA